MAIESVRKVADTALPTRFGNFRILGFEGTLSGVTPCCNQAHDPRTARESAVALVMGEITNGSILPTRKGSANNNFGSLDSLKIGGDGADNGGNDGRDNGGTGRDSAGNGSDGAGNGSDNGRKSSENSSNTATAPPLVRIHSQCLTGDVFHSLRCDCRAQLELALHSIAAEGAGIIVYDQQEGRGIGLMAKLKAYELQEQGRDTVEANIELGYKPDCREFELQAAILRHLGITAVRLMTNNPEKVAALERAGVRVVERVPAEVPVEETFERYLQVKQSKMGHIFRTDGTVETLPARHSIETMGEISVDPAGVTLDSD